MESPCLSILVPLLVKGLRERAAVARKTGLIIHNMVKVHLQRQHWPLIPASPAPTEIPSVLLHRWSCFTMTLPLAGICFRVCIVCG